MKTQWTIELHTRSGQPCGYIEADSIDSCVEQAQDEMPWCTAKYLRSLCRKCKTERTEESED